MSSALHYLKAISPREHLARIREVHGHKVVVTGLPDHAAVGDTVRLDLPVDWVTGEIQSIIETTATVVLAGGCQGITVGAPVIYLGPPSIQPSIDWLGRSIDCMGRPIDGRGSLAQGARRPLRVPPPSAFSRRPMGARLSTGLAVLDTFLPIARGQRVGIFAGSGVGKSTLLGNLASELEADVVIYALIGERGREVAEVIRRLEQTREKDSFVVVAETSDSSSLQRRSALYTALSVAEFFRDQDRHVLLLVDSVTRFAEAHREVALGNGEAASYSGFPVSVIHEVMSICERAGPGGGTGQGDITAVFSVLVAGGDFEGPVADIIRGVLDGHIVLSREIAERGRFPAIDVLRSVSRCLPGAATDEENDVLLQARASLSLYNENEIMIRSGLYTSGSSTEIDRAVTMHPRLDAFCAGSSQSPEDAFLGLKEILNTR